MWNKTIFRYSLSQLFLLAAYFSPFSEAGTRLQEFWDQDPEKNVAAKHEDKADCIGNCDSPDPHNSPLRLPWVQLWKISTSHFTLLFQPSCDYIWNGCHDFVCSKNIRSLILIILKVSQYDIRMLLEILIGLSIVARSSFTLPILSSFLQLNLVVLSYFVCILTALECYFFFSLTSYFIKSVSICDIYDTFISLGLVRDDF